MSDDLKPLDDATDEEVLVAALLLGFEWADDDVFNCRWYPCEVCDGAPHCCLSCWGVYVPCTREDAARRFLYARGLLSRLPTRDL